MPSALTVMVEHANCGPGFPDGEFRGFLADGAPDALAYRYTPPPGTIVAALDWQVVLGTGADLIAYASLVWTAYERFVKPLLAKRKRVSSRPGETAFLLVHVKRRDGSFAQFALGHEYTERERFVEAFVSEVASLRAGPGPTDDQLMTALDASRDWTRTDERS